jgi:hypothetical protein
MMRFYGIKPLLAISASLVLIVPAVAIALTTRLSEQTQSAENSRDGNYDSRVKGAGALLGVSGTVEYTLWDASGHVKEQGFIDNTVNDQAFDVTFNRLFNDIVVQTAGYDAIAALSVAPATDDPSDGVDAASITLNLDGDSGDPGDQNPANGVVGAPSDGSGQGTVSVTFTAQGSADVRQLVLTKATEDNTADAGAVAIADADIFSFVDVPDISLNTGDSVAYTWTINLD